MLKNLLKSFFILILITLSLSVFASETNGTIDNTDHYALLCTNDSCSTTTGINFKTTNGTPISITDSGISGYAWSETFGWINFNPSTSGVTNTSNGVLGGYAWGSGSGWINFAPTHGGVSINSTGQFVGYAWAQNYGWIKFDCSVSGACVKTDWRPLSARTRTSSGGSQIILPAVNTNPVVAPTVVIPKEDKDDKNIDIKVPVKEPITEIKKENHIPVNSTPKVNVEIPVSSPTVVDTINDGIITVIVPIENIFTTLSNNISNFVSSIFSSSKSDNQLVKQNIPDEEYGKFTIKAFNFEKIKNVAVNTVSNFVVRPLEVAITYVSTETVNIYEKIVVFLKGLLF